MERKIIFCIFVLLIIGNKIFPQNYVELIGLSKLELENILKADPVHFEGDTFAYYIKQGNTNLTNLVSFSIDPVKGIYKIMTLHNYNNRWTKNKVNELTKIYGEPRVKDDTYAFRSNVNENILIVVFSNILDKKRYGIIMTMILSD